MTPNEYILLAQNNLDETIKRYKEGTLSPLDKQIMDMLGEIIIVEEKTASTSALFNQLKESYFHSDLETATFLNQLYQHDKEAMDTYFDIYLEQLFEGEVLKDEITNRVSKMQAMLSAIAPNILATFNQKLEQYQSDFQM